MNIKGALSGAQQPMAPAWLESAHSAIDAGYRVFPLQGKVPLKTFQWRHFNTNDKNKITQWAAEHPEATGYGIALGADDLVLDIDPRNFPPGRNVEHELIQAYPQFAQTYIVKTPGDGTHFGHHVYLKKASEVKVKKSQQNLPGVDLLSEGAYVVGAGSRTASGEYKSLKTTNQAQVAPGDLLALLEPPAEAVTKGSAESLVCLEQFVSECRIAAPAIQGQGGDNATLALALRGRDLGLPLEVVFQVMRDEWNLRCLPVWNDNELHRKVENAYKYASGAAGQATAAAVFMDFAPIHPPEQNAVRVPIAQQTEKKSKSSQATAVVDSASDCELWRDASGAAYITFNNKGHFEHWKLQSKGAKAWLRQNYYLKSGGKPISESAFKEAMAALDARARFDGTEHKAELRGAKRGQVVYVDVGDDDWNQVQIDSRGYRVVSRSEVRFIRSSETRPLALPVEGSASDLLKLQKLLKLPRTTYVLLLGFLVGCFKFDSPFPILIASGEQGTGKSTLTKVIHQLADPVGTPLRSLPRNEQDMMIAVSNRHIYSLDNVSRLARTVGLGDSLCRIATGGGNSYRTHHENDEETCFNVMKPIILNGIGEFASQEDLVDRALVLDLPVISESERLPDEQFWKEFEELRPALTGALFSAVSGALRRLHETKLDRLPRMADLALWVKAAEPELGLEPGEFGRCYEENRKEAVRRAVEESPLAGWILNDLALPFENSASALLEMMKLQVPFSRALPYTPRALSAHLNRLAPQLRKIGVNITRPPRGSEKRLIRIEREDPFDKLK